MFCVKCGSQLPAGSMFCGQCGQPLHPSQGPVPAQAAPNQPAPQPWRPVPATAAPVGDPRPPASFPRPPAFAPPRPSPPQEPAYTPPQYAAAPYAPPQYAPPAYPLTGNPPPQQQAFAAPAYPPGTLPSAAGNPTAWPAAPLAQFQPGFAQPAPAGPAGGPMPPEMHWAVVLVLSWITGGLGGLVWIFRQALFVKKIDPASKAVPLLVVSLLGIAGQLVVFIGMATASSESAAFGGLGLIMLLNLVIIVAGLMAIFGIRRSLVRYYNTVEPMGLQLGGAMTFFFNILYFQYHLSRIAQWKKTGRFA